MAEIIGILIAALSGLAIIFPFFTKTARLEKGEKGESSWLELRKKSLYETIKDLEFEYIAGKLDEKNYRDLRQKLEKEVVQILKKIDTISSINLEQKRIEDRVEKEIGRLSSQPKKPQKDNQKAENESNESF